MNKNLYRWMRVGTRQRGALANILTPFSFSSLRVGLMDGTRTTASSWSEGRSDQDHADEDRDYQDHADENPSSRLEGGGGGLGAVR